MPGEEKHCANCNGIHGPIDVCLLGAVAGLIVQRETEPAPAPEQLAAIDADTFWDYIGPAADWLEGELRDARAAAELERRQAEGRETDALEAPCRTCGNPAYVVSDNVAYCDLHLEGKS